MFEIPMTALYLMAGALGGIVFHSYWLIKIGQQSNDDKFINENGLKRVRLSLMALSSLVGAVAGLIVWVWFSSDLKNSLVASNQVVVFCFIAGLSGDGLLGLLKRASQFGS